MTVGMSLHTDHQDPADALRDILVRGRTGCLKVVGAERHRVYTMQGAILAAHGPDDGIWVVRRLLNNGALTDRVANNFMRSIEKGARMEDVLIGHVPDALLLSVLEERFRQNLLEFLQVGESFAFEPLDAIFVDNVQIGHDPFVLLDELVEVRSLVLPLIAAGNITVRPGLTMPRRQNEARVLDLCDPAITLEELYVFSPYEQGPTALAVRSLLEIGALVSDQRVRFEPRMNPPRPIEPDSYDVEDLFNVDEEPTDAPIEDLPPLPVPEPPPVQASWLDDAGDFGDPHSSIPPLDSAPPAPIAELRPPVDSPLDPPEPPPVGPPQDEIDAAWVSDSVVPPLDPEADEEVPPLARVPRGQRVVDIDSDELAMFDDYDRNRGMGFGEFVTEQHNLDKIDLGERFGAAGAADETLSDIIEMGSVEDMRINPNERVVAFTFSGPRLEDHEARHKLGVASQVLMRVSRALEKANGPGTGGISIQLLFDGAPMSFGAVLHGVEATPQGSFDAEVILKNLRRRPEAERRILLERAVMDLIDRALSIAAESLSEDDLDILLVDIAGYQQRMRL